MLLTSEAFMERLDMQQVVCSQKGGFATGLKNRQANHVRHPPFFYSPSGTPWSIDSKFT